MIFYRTLMSSTKNYEIILNWTQLDILCMHLSINILDKIDKHFCHNWT